MLDTLLLSSVAKQMMNADEVEVEGNRLPVRHTSSRHLRMLMFTMGEGQYTAIEQNPEIQSRWGRIARSGHQVVRFKDTRRNQYVAVALDGEVKEYGSGRSLVSSAADRDSHPRHT